MLKYAQEEKRMNLNTALLLVSGLAYICAVALPYPSLKNTDRIKEKISFFILGITILFLVLAREGNLFNNSLVWTILGIFYVMASWLSYIGHSQWNMLWKQEISDVAQMYMAAWDMLIAISCFMIA